MDKRSPVERAEEWRVDWLSEQPLCRTPIGAASRGADIVALFFYSFFEPFQDRIFTKPMLDPEQIPYGLSVRP